MRFKEIANPADQLALWKLISDKMWAAFDEPVPQPNQYAATATNNGAG